MDKINILDIVEIARMAGEVIMQVYKRDYIIEIKDDLSPVTEADRLANTIIVSKLKSLNVQFPILSEEGENIAYAERKEWTYFWMVDPLDGTKEFIRRNGEFTVNIALIHLGEPILGVVYAPEKDEMYYAVKGQGAYKNGKAMACLSSENMDKPFKILVSRSHSTVSQKQTDIINLLKTSESFEIMAMGSSLKMCMVASGDADLYPRMGPTMEWDTAAADAILRESGKALFQLRDRTRLTYNKVSLVNPAFVACSETIMKTCLK